jgi:hypothetical protein
MTAVLLIAYNRFEITKKVIAQLKRQQTPRLYLALDAPIDKRDAEIQELIIEHTKKELNNTAINIYRLEVNLGPGVFIPRAISYMFEYEDFGIILEDDCVASDTFFRFCTQLGNDYSRNEKVKAICGTNLVSRESENLEYFASSIFNPWGWATWKSRWDEYSTSNSIYTLKFRRKLFQYYDSKDLRKLYSQYLSRATRMDSRVWTGHWIATQILNDGEFLTPTLNLVTNVGFSGAGVNSFLSLAPFFTRDSSESKVEKFQKSAKVYSVDFEKEYFEVLKHAVPIFSRQKILTMYLRRKGSRFRRLINPNQ